MFEVPLPGLPSKTELDLQAQRDVPIAILVVLFKHVRHAFKADARLYEQIEAHCIAPAAVVRLIEECDELL